VDPARSVYSLREHSSIAYTGGRSAPDRRREQSYTVEHNLTVRAKRADPCSRGLPKRTEELGASHR
jgi:hypothetical protein